jgi:hypothetical protein
MEEEYPNSLLPRGERFQEVTPIRRLTENSSSLYPSLKAP